MANFYSSRIINLFAKSLILFGLIIYSEKSLAQGYILNEDFFTASNTTPPLGWIDSIVSGTTSDLWRFNNPGGRIVNFPITPNFAIFDSDNYSQGGGPEESHLISKEFDASFSPNILLQFDQYFVGGQSGNGYVDVFDGTNWFSIFHNINTTPNTERRIFNISDQVGGVSNARIRFRWEGDSSKFWAIDNIRVITPYKLDLALTDITYPLNSSQLAGIVPIKVNLKSFSFDTITSVVINWSANGVFQTPFNWTGSLTYEQTATDVIIGNYNFPSGVPINLEVWVSNPNGQLDINSQNDSLSRTTTLYAPLCGIYTIGGSSPDFPNVKEAVTALNDGGISCAVKFKIRNGYYLDDLIINDINGTSATNTITFESENLNYNLVFLQCKLTLNGTKYINFDKLSFILPFDSVITTKNYSGWISITNSNILGGRINFASNIGKIIIKGNKINSVCNLTSNLCRELIFSDNEITGSIYNKVNITYNGFTGLPITNALVNQFNPTNNYNYTTLNASSYPLTSSLVDTIQFSNSDNAFKIKQLPFAFNFYGNNYDSIFIGTNGYVSFGVGFSINTIPSIPSSTSPNNFIALFATDLNLVNGGTVTTFVSGSAPNRIFVINYNNVPFYPSTGRLNGQILLYEGNNIVETCITLVDYGVSNKIGITGVENLLGTVGSSPSSPTNLIACNIFIENNTFFGSSYGLTLITNEFVKSVIHKNLLNGSLAFPEFAINLSGNGNTVLNNNKIFNYTKGINNTNSNVVISNNYIQTFEVGIQNNASNSKIIYNSINNLGYSASSTAFKLSPGNNLIVKNNIFSNYNNGYGIFYTGNSIFPGNDWNNNNYFSISRNLGYFSNPIKDLNLWKTITNQDNLSKNVNPYFSNNIDLKPNHSVLDKAGQIITNINIDIDSTLRSTTPDIGAKEYSICTNDAGINLISNIHDTIISPSTLPIIVELQNHGTAPLLSVEINWMVDGGLQPPFIWIGFLDTNQTSQVTIGNYYFPFNNSNLNSIIAWTSSPNQTIDCNRINDSSATENLLVKTILCGTYTIGGLTPDFPTYVDAVNALNNGRINCPVVFKMRNATYFSDVPLNFIDGSSIINTITFESENGDSSLVTIEGMQALNGTKYIHYKKIGFANPLFDIIQTNNFSGDFSFTNCKMNTPQYALKSIQSTGTINFLNNNIEQGRIDINSNLQLDANIKNNIITSFDQSSIDISANPYLVPNSLTNIAYLFSPVNNNVPVNIPSAGFPITSNTQDTLHFSSTFNTSLKKEIPFTFNFFGNNYDSIYINSNGYITFGANYLLPINSNIPSSTLPNNFISLCGNNLILSPTSTITSFTVGTAPNRKFIIKYDSLPFNGGSGNTSGEIIISESSNNIELYIEEYDFGTSSTSIKFGIENGTGIAGYKANIGGQDSIICNFNISGNQIRSSEYGINANCGLNTATNISLNYINGPNSMATGITFYGKGKVEVTRNKIEKFKSGISFYGDNGKVYNNFVSATDNGLTLGGDNNKILYNSINVTNPAINSQFNSSALTITNKNNQTIINNICSNSGIGFSVYISADSIPSLGDWNFNNFYSANKTLGYFKKPYKAIQDWIKLTHKDSSSIETNPYFLSNNELIPTNSLINNKGISVVETNIDIDSTIRNSTPDIGAIEFDLCNYDAGINEIVGIPNEPVYSGIVPIKAIIQNHGLIPLTSALINWSIDGVLQTPFIWTGNLQTYENDTIFIGNHLFPFKFSQKVPIEVWTSLPNGQIDCKPPNDRPNAEYIQVKTVLCGTYTVGGLNPDFPTLIDVATTLNIGSISCSVIFKIRDEVFPGNVTLGKIIGSSPFNTITFETQNGIANNMSLDGKLTFKGTKYVYLNKIKVNGNLEPSITLDSLAGDISIINCIVTTAQSAFSIYSENSVTGNVTVKNNKVVGSISLLSKERSNFDISNNKIEGGVGEIIYVNNEPFTTLPISSPKLFVLNPNNNYSYVDSIATGYPLNSSVRDSIKFTSTTNTNAKVFLPFTFNFYGINYDSIFVSKNGFICFSPLSGPDYVTNIPTTSSPNNIVSLFGHFMDNSLNSITNFTTGNAPNRKFIIEYNKLEFSNSGGVASGQIILNEGNNYIELFLKEVDYGYYLKSIICGVENKFGNLGVKIEQPTSNDVYNINILNNDLSALIPYNSKGIRLTTAKGTSFLVKNNKAKGNNSLFQQNQIDIAGLRLEGNGIGKVIGNRFENYFAGVDNLIDSTLIANNFIYVDGIGVNNIAPNTRIIYNSILTSSPIFNAGGITINNAANQVVRNNLVSSSGFGHSIYISSTYLPLGINCDFNNFYSQNGQIGFFNTTLSSLSQWQLTTGYDANSKDINPFYPNNVELRTTNKLLNGVASVNAEVFDDIDTQLRFQLAPDPGADEFSVDFGIVGLESPTLSCLQSDNTPVVINLKKFGDIPFTDIILAYNVNNGPIFTDTIPGVTSNDLIYTFSQTQNLAAYGDYDFKIWLVNNIDDNILNDTLAIHISSRPTIDLSFVYTSSCAGSPMNFSANSEDAITDITFVWEFGDGHIASGQNVSHAYDTSRVYSVNLYAYNNFGCYSLYSASVTVLSSPIADFSVENACEGNLINLINLTSVSSGTLNYNWNIGNGSTYNIQTPTPFLLSTGNYNISLVVRNSNGCRDSIHKLLQVYPSPIITLPDFGPLCTNGSPIYINGANPGGGLFTGSNIYSSYFDPNLSGPGQFGLSYTYTDSLGCLSTKLDTILVDNPPTLNISINGGLNICEGDSTTLTCTTNGSIQWSTGDTSSSITVDTTGIYFVVSSSINGCVSNSSPLGIVVYQNGIISNYQNLSICNGEFFTLPNGQIISDSGIYISNLTNIYGCDSIIQTSIQVVEQSFSDTTINACDSYFWNGYTDLSSGTYSYTTTNANGCDSILTLHLTINNSSLAPISIVASNSTINVGDQTTLTVLGGNLGTSANWYWYEDSCGGNNIGVGNSITISPSISKTYFVRAEGLCNNTNCQSILITVDSTVICGPTIITNSQSDTICKGTSVTLTVQGVLHGGVWRWYKNSCGGILIGAGNSITVSPNVNTTYFVKAVGDSCANGICISKSIYVNRKPQTPSFIAGIKTGLCNATGISYSVTPIIGVIYNWNVPAGATIINGQGTSNITVNFSDTLYSIGTCAGSNSICVTASNSCGTSNPRSSTIKLQPKNLSKISGPANACSGQQVTFSVVNTFGVSSYNWTIPTSWSIVSGLGTNTIKLLSGNFGGTLKVYASNDCGNTIIETKVVPIISCAKEEENLSNRESIQIIPNPTKNKITISTNLDIESIEMYNVLGELIFKVPFTSTLDLSPYYEGIYILKCIKNDIIFINRIELIKD